MGQQKVLVSDKLSEAGVAILKASPSLQVDVKTGLKEEELAEIIGGYDALVIRSASKVTARVLEKAHKLKVIGRAGIGVDNVDVPAASRRGVVVMNTPTGNTVTTAEHAITLLMSLARKIPQATASMRAGQWEKTKFQGREVTGKTLGLIGMGNIGRIVADRAQGLKMQVIAYDPVLTAEKAQSLGVELVTLDQLFSRADFITVHAPLTPDTKGLLGDKAFAKMKSGVLIVNAARGGIVDETALLKALESGKVAGAALDVFEKEPVDPKNPLLQREDFICTPHLGASTDEAQERVSLEIAEQIVDFLNEGTVKNAVNVPTLPKEIAERVEPYLNLATRLGRLAAEFTRTRTDQSVKEITIIACGEPGDFGLRSVAHQALSGFLSLFTEEPVNPMSAPYEAKERGIRVSETRVPSLGRNLKHGVALTLKTDNTVTEVIGTLSLSGEPRLMGIDTYELDASLAGTTLVIQNEDRPGVIGSVGTLLGQQSINCSSMQVGLDPKTKRAIALWSVDGQVSIQTLDEIKKLANVTNVFCVAL